MNFRDIAYILTSKRGTAIDAYSMRIEGAAPSVMIFQNRDDAERYVIMLEEDADYIVGDTLQLQITEIPLGHAIDIFNEKGTDFIFISEDDLFIPPDSNFFPPPAADF